MKFSASRRWILAGVISYGRGCGQARHAGVYTRVVSYSEWINATINTGDTFSDAIFIMHDKSHRDKSIDNFLEEFLSNSSSSRFSSAFIYTTILICLCLYFI